MKLAPGQSIYLVGDVHERMAALEDHSVDLVVTSPPFLALRSYLPADHPDKHREIGGELTPADFLDTLLGLSAEWRRVLAPHGSIAIELGDTYAGSGGAGGDYGPDGLRAGQPKFRQAKASPDTGDPEYARTNKGEGQVRVSGGGGWPLDKSLTGIPTLYAWSLAYGRNLLTGHPSPAGRWRVRNLIPWVRPNPPVGQLGDKCRPATSYITIATLARNRWWDMEDCRTPHADHSLRYAEAGSLARKGWNVDRFDGGERLGPLSPGGAPLLDWWQIPAHPYPGAHYATFPPQLPARLTKLMCPREVCRRCGTPRRRITVGWTDCGHNDYRPGIVLDPFAGVGTTLAVATGLGRAAIGIDLDERNVDLARMRVGMFMEVA